MNKADTLFEIANATALEIDDFFDVKGSGIGNHSTNQYIREVGRRAMMHFGSDLSEVSLCGDNSLKVDYYFAEEGTIVEIALGLRNPNTEYEKDIMKAIIAKNLGNEVQKLVFISKPGGEKKCKQPGRLAMRNWLKNNIGITIEVRDLG